MDNTFNGQSLTATATDQGTCKIEACASIVGYAALSSMCISAIIDANKKNYGAQYAAVMLASVINELDDDIRAAYERVSGCELLLDHEGPGEPSDVNATPEG